MKKIFFTTAATLLLLAGCEQERMPEPNAATCAPDAFQAALNEMRSEANREAFTEECRGLKRLAGKLACPKAIKKQSSFTFVSPGLSAKGNTDQLVA